CGFILCFFEQHFGKRAKDWLNALDWRREERGARRIGKKRGEVVGGERAGQSRRIGRAEQARIILGVVVARIRQWLPLDLVSQGQQRWSLAARAIHPRPFPRPPRAPS